jgi:hypothetical protein
MGGCDFNKSAKKNFPGIYLSVEDKGSGEENYFTYTLDTYILANGKE